MSDTWTVIFIVWGIALCLLALWIYRMAVKRKQMDKLIGNRYEMRPELGKIRLRSFEDGKELEPITLANAMILIFNCPSCKRQLNPTFAYEDKDRICTGTVTCACGHKVRMAVSLYWAQDSFNSKEVSPEEATAAWYEAWGWSKPPEGGTFTSEGGTYQDGQALDTQEKNQA